MLFIIFLILYVTKDRLMNMKTTRAASDTFKTSQPRHWSGGGFGCTPAPPPPLLPRILHLGCTFCLNCTSTITSDSAPFPSRSKLPLLVYIQLFIWWPSFLPQGFHVKHELDFITVISDSEASGVMAGLSDKWFISTNLSLSLGSCPCTSSLEPVFHQIMISSVLLT